MPSILKHIFQLNRGCWLKLFIRWKPQGVPIKKNRKNRKIKRRQGKKRKTRKKWVGKTLVKTRKGPEAGFRNTENHEWKVEGKRLNSWCLCSFGFLFILRFFWQHWISGGWYQKGSNVAYFWSYTCHSNLYLNL